MDAHVWCMENFLKKDAALPLSFVYGGRKSSELLKTWTRSTVSSKADSAKNLHVVACKDPETGLEVTCTATEYLGFPAVEWVLGFRNAGKADTPILESIRALDTTLVKKDDACFTLHHMRGSLCAKSDFAPICEILPGLVHKKLAPVEGISSNGGDWKSSNGSFPFFDLTFDDGGITFAIGWSGQWAAEFEGHRDNKLAVTAGMEQTHLKLLPGERIRTPRILMFFWDGRMADAHNGFRRLILKHHTPHRDGKPVTLPLAANTFFKYDNGSAATEENQIAEIRALVKAGIEIECYWMDAGWYPAAGSTGTSDVWAYGVGNWFPREKSFPRGLRPVADEAKKHGFGFVLWFEPERVYPGTWLHTQHPEWLLAPNDETLRIHPNWLLDLGNPDALGWLTDHVSSMIAQIGITVYRQDFNFAPLEYWRSADAPDRQGISEMRHIEGLYAFWDELLRRHPGLVIDNCASGGRRIDLETISRSVALWRSDYCFEPEGVQCQTIAINQYLPCTSLGVNSANAYAFRSTLACGLSISWDHPGVPLDIGELCKRVKEFKLLRPLFYGDFYPLTSHSIESDVWCTYQFDRKDLNLGAVFAFRREESPFSVGRFKLHGLDADGEYEFTHIDSCSKQRFNGKELMDTGIEIKMPTAPCSVLLTYGRV